jgi:hypothetical protein
MHFQGAVIKEQCVTFRIIIIKPHVLQSENDKSQMQNFEYSAFGRIPIILMTHDSWGVPTYYGSKDIVNSLSRISIGT